MKRVLIAIGVLGLLFLGIVGIYVFREISRPIDITEGIIGPYIFVLDNQPAGANDKTGEKGKEFTRALGEAGLGTGGGIVMVHSGIRQIPQMGMIISEADIAKVKTLKMPTRVVKVSRRKGWKANISFDRGFVAALSVGRTAPALIEKAKEAGYLSYYMVIRFDMKTKEQVIEVMQAGD